MIGGDGLMKKIMMFRSAFFLFIGLAAGIIFSAKLNIFPLVQSQEPRFQAEPSSLEGFSMEDAVINVANTAGNAVVSISTERISKIGGGRRFYFSQPFGEQSPFGRDEFDHFFDDFFGGIPEREFKQQGLGSGVIIDKEGYILTNEHVIDDADKITVTLFDGREFKGEIKGRDARSDLAVIKINAHGLPVATLGDSDNLKIGQWVVAIGNPFGFAMQNPEPTVTIGVISALHRTLGRIISADKDYSDLIQTDAAINPGNSGGPLVNLKGEIVGINVAIFSTSGGYQGVGFAIPVNSAKKIISRLIEGKKILYGWLGVTVQDLDEELAKYFGLAAKDGVLIAKVLEDSPAKKAGLKESDILKEFNQKAIRNVKELLSAVAGAEVGRKVKVVVIRDKKDLSFEIEVGERPQDIEEKAFDQEGVSGWRGLEVEDLTLEKARHLGLKEDNGALISAVEPGSPADTAGLSAGDIILEINKQQVKGLADYKKITSGLKGDALVRTSRGYSIVKEKND
jgi:serine protease Do